MAKLEDVARLANVSKTTVSRVLNKRGYLSKETIDKVHQAMDALNYRPNAVARQLSKSQTNLIGIILPSVANPFFGELTLALERRLYSQNYKVLIGNSMNDLNKEQDYLEQVLNKQVDGLIVGTHNQGLSEYRNLNLPIVSIDRVINDDIPIIESDNYDGARLATSILIEQGAKKIIHTNGPQHLEIATRRRRQAYEDIMNENKLKPITYEIDFNIDELQKKQRFYAIFNDHPDVDGIFASNDTDAALIMQIAAEIGRKIPDDLMLIGYDGAKITRELLPNLTTIIQPIDLIAETAVEILNKRINGKKTEPEYILPIKLWHGRTAFINEK